MTGASIVADVIIHRCILRVVRRDGWSWGADPDRLLKAAVAALPLLIARRLGDLFSDEIEREITERLSISVPVKLSELLELGSQANTTNETSSSLPATLLEQRLATAVKFAFASAEASFEEVPKAPAQVHSIPDLRVEPGAINEPQSHPLLRALLRWKREDELAVHLAFFNEQELEAWLATLIATVAKLANSRGAPWAQRISQLIASLAEHSNSPVPHRLSRLRLSLIAFIEIGEQFITREINEAAVLRTCEELIAELSLPVNRPSLDSAELESQLRVENVSPLSLVSPVVREVAAPAPVITIQPVARTEFGLRSVLPFLLLGPLSKIGYFDALAATLEANGLSAQAPLFAAALAFKVLTPPARGWRRDNEDLVVAAAFAGLETPPPGDVLAEFARKLSGHLTALDSLLSYSLVKGHHPDSALLLHRTRGEDGAKGLLLIEPDGLFPVFWASDVQSLLPALRYFGETHLLVQQSSAEVETLQQLHQAGFRFITDALPTRSENWRELRRSPQERWYSNDVNTKQARLVRLVEDLTTTAEETERIWRALKVDRPSIPTDRDSELERSVTMAASLALGTISWVLWRGRETVTPLLALERFGSLSGKVRFTSSSVDIHLPLGQRYTDLHEHNLLADIRDLPWLDGRKVEFFGG